MLGLPWNADVLGSYEPQGCEARLFLQRQSRAVICTAMWARLGDDGVVIEGNTVENSV